MWEYGEGGNPLIVRYYIISFLEAIEGYMDERPQLTKLTLDMGALTLDLPVSQDSLVNVQGKAAKLPCDFFIKGNQPLVKGCSVKVDYINEEPETKNNFLKY